MHCCNNCLVMFSLAQENIVANFLESKDIDVATKAVRDIKGPRYVTGYVFNNLLPSEKEYYIYSSL